MKVRDARGFAIPLVSIFGGLLLMMMSAFSMLSRGAVSTVHRVMAGHDLEQVLQQALEEAHYRFTLSHAPSSSTWSAGSRMKALARLGPQGPGTRAFPAPDAKLAPASLDHDASLYLKEGGGEVLLVPDAMVASLGTAAGIEVAPVRIRVIERRRGPLRRAERPEVGDAPHNLLARMGLPPGLDEMQVTWGVVELAVEGSVGRGLRITSFRRCIQRKLFAVAESRAPGGERLRHAYVFPQPIGQVMQRDR